MLRVVNPAAKFLQRHFAFESGPIDRDLRQGLFWIEVYHACRSVNHSVETKWSDTDTSRSMGVIYSPDLVSFYFGVFSRES
ncbi:MAG: hypothetical protein WBO58_14635, partial [Gammaproteobacteria bacterium]